MVDADWFFGVWLVPVQELVPVVWMPVQLMVGQSVGMIRVQVQ